MTGRIKEIQLPLVSDYQKGWLAGLLDGDGVIGLHISKTGSLRKNKRGFTWKPVIVFCNTNLDIIQAVCRLLNKKRPPRQINKANGKRRKKIWKVSLTKAETQWVCEHLILHGKERQRVLLIEAIQLSNKVGGRRPTDHPSELRLIQIYKAMRQLNKRGVSPSPTLLTHEESIYMALGLEYVEPQFR